MRSGHHFGAVESDSLRNPYTDGQAVYWCLVLYLARSRCSVRVCCRVSRVLPFHSEEVLCPSSALVIASLPLAIPGHMTLYLPGFIGCFCLPWLYPRSGPPGSGANHPAGHCTPRGGDHDCIRPDPARRQGQRPSYPAPETQVWVGSPKGCL